MVALLDEIRKFNRTKAWMSAHTHARIRHGNRARDAGPECPAPQLLRGSWSSGLMGGEAWQEGKAQRNRVLLDFMSLPVHEKIITDKCI